MKQIVLRDIALRTLQNIFYNHDTYTWSNDPRVSKITLDTAFPDKDEDESFPAVIVNNVTLSMSRISLGDTAEIPLQCTQGPDGAALHVGYTKSLLWRCGFSYLVGSTHLMESESLADYIAQTLSLSAVLPQVGFTLESLVYPPAYQTALDSDIPLFINELRLSGFIVIEADITVPPNEIRPLRHAAIHTRMFNDGVQALPEPEGPRRG